MTTPEIKPAATPTAGIPTPSAPVAAPAALSPTNPSIGTTSPTVSVTVPNTAGTVTFSLVVTDNLGIQSTPAYATVTVQAPPTAKLTASPSTIAAGGTITLSGAGSASSGSFANYLFSLVPAPAVVT